MQRNSVEFIFMCLLVFMATWRLASLFAFERGPFDVFIWIRKKVYFVSATQTGIVGHIFSTLNDGLACLWCNSVWFGMLLSLFIARNVLEWFIIGLSASATAIFIEEKINGNRINKNNTQSQ